MQTDEYRKLFEHEDRYWWFVGRRKLALALLKKYLPTGRPERLLDLGCGITSKLIEKRSESWLPVGFWFSACPLIVGFGALTMLR
ncbi:MAG: hypothetical protein K8R88_05830 [Armatimonadetes bacterium]|nr:hypothetical protein [Armatimonadota bacterium]